MGCSWERSFNGRSSSILISVAACDLLVQTYVATNRLPQAINQLQAAALEEPEQCVVSHDAGAYIRTNA